MAKKLIEVALPLEKINAECAREKSIRHGHPSTLHLWWARRPLAAARAVIWSSLVDDPSAHPERFPTEEAQAKERLRLFDILEKLVVWENSNDETILAAAKREIENSNPKGVPALLDPFAGGGAIPLEAQRLGLEAHAHDLNPVAVMINKAMIEIPPKFAGVSPVNPERQRQGAANTGWKGAAGLAEDVRFYGEWMKREAFNRIGHLYPKAKMPDGSEATVIAWIWARTVKCPNPACGCEMPLASSYVLSKKKGKEAWVDSQYIDGKFNFTVVNGKYPAEKEHGTKYINEKGKAKKGVFMCPLCHTAVDASIYIDSEANEGRMGTIPMAIVCESQRGRSYISIKEDEILQLTSEIENYYSAYEIDNKVSHAKGRGTFASNAQGGYYGFFEFKDYFTHRQLAALTTFSELVGEAQKKAEQDAVAAGMANDHLPLSEGGTGAKAYGEAVGVYLAFLVDKLADLGNSLNRWEPNAECPRQLFARQAIPMVWDYAEGNIFSSSSGSWQVLIDNLMRCFTADSFCFRRDIAGVAQQYNAQEDSGLRNIIVSTDPPYYDNIGYADLSDFWVNRKTCGI